MDISIRSRGRGATVKENVKPSPTLFPTCPPRPLGRSLALGTYARALRTARELREAGWSCWEGGGDERAISRRSMMRIRPCGAGEPPGTISVATSVVLWKERNRRKSVSLLGILFPEGLASNQPGHTGRREVLSTLEVGGRRLSRLHRDLSQEERCSCSRTLVRPHKDNDLFARGQERDR